MFLTHLPSGEIVRVLAFGCTHHADGSITPMTHVNVRFPDGTRTRVNALTLDHDPT